MVEISTIVQTSLATVTGVGLTLTDTWQAVIGDRIAAYRLNNAMALQLKVEAELKKSGLKLNAAKVPDRYAFAWFEEATKQDEDEIQELFAKLLARAASGNEGASDRRLLDIVTRFTPSDAKVFKNIYASSNWRAFEMAPNRVQQWSFSSLHYIAKEAVGNDGKKSLEHLITLGAISQSYEIDTRSAGAAISYAMTHNRTPDISKVEIRDVATSTAIGLALYRALHADEAEQQLA